MSVSRRFSAADQRLFADLSGDVNPLHMDAVAARRSLIGRPAVHGIHAVLWALEVAAPSVAIRAVTGEFLRPIFLDEEVAVRADERRGQPVLTVEAGGVRLVKLTLTPGEAPVSAFRPDPAEPEQGVACARDFEAIETLEGFLALHLPAEAALLFPRALALLGAARMAGLLALTRLVGMDCPGSSALFSAFKLDFAGGECGGDGLAWRVEAVDPRFRLLRMAVTAPGLAGMVEAFHRPPPRTQAGMAEITALLRPDEFAGQRALVVGGSRGIGEVAAKMIAAAGGEVVVTYATGAADAARVAAEIADAGGRCKAMQLDVLETDGLPDDLAGWVTHLYYFATPKIFDRRPPGFDTAAFHRFARVYVDGFAALVQSLAAGGRGLACLYPSSTALDERLPQLAEYSSAKAAGEALCAILANAHPGLAILVERLPRLATDQTLTMDGFPAEAPPAVLLPVLRRLHALHPPNNTVY